ncbi:maleylacetoacetate isomerase [Shewanella eurypsychrophilus]|uniref:Maleylacetoacetate isomerase n=1 Tax=Shewanella eurypsychrophilus TaxID=2593656 RepID=A0ABX6V7Q4_9GAMM|nr:MULTISPECIES: maleylacetoacetate isomerase [Shewanella]QFU23386.1 maleylacetoacetate isomerase [Shewanella sp. YLB-09]QPG58616.1 maleylacetoacetate isomerase [Shewanella eurypsychrophilus]
MLKLYGYWRSSAAYRVRIALNLKELDAEQISVHLVKNGGEQHQSDYALMNPQELVPTLIDTDDQGKEFVLSQSMAILEYLDERYPESKLIPSDVQSKALMRSLAFAIACEVHPLNNLKVLQYLASELAITDEAKTAWYHHWIHEGFSAFEKQLEKHAGRFCFGDSITVVDLCLIPQVYNAHRFKVDLSAYPNILRITENCNQLDAFIQAMPENQFDAV